MDRDTILPKVKKIPGKNAQRWQDYHLRFAAPATYVKGFIWDRSRPAVGPFCTDVDDNVIMDFVSHVGSAPLGYNHPEIMRLVSNFPMSDPDRYAGSDFITGYGEKPDSCNIPTPAHMHHKLIEITKQFGFDMAYLTSTGTEAVENAIKICYSHRKNFGYGITFMGAFHGRTLGALSLNRSKRAHRKFYPQIPNVIDLNFCDCEQECTCGWMKSINGLRINELEKMLDSEIGLVQPEEVAYIIIEPVQGEGGYRFPNRGFMKDIVKTASEHKIPLICDEIQSGMGRTGKWWACEHFGMKPDIIAAGKGLRIGATIGRSRFFPKENARISSTWGEGNALATAVGYKTIEIIQKENLLKNSEITGNYFLKRLNELKEKHPIVKGVKGLGLMDRIDFDNKEMRDKVIERCFKKGLLLIGCGHRSIRFLPPLNVTQREIDIAVEILESVVKGL